MIFDVMDAATDSSTSTPPSPITTTRTTATKPIDSLDPVAIPITQLLPHAKYSLSGISFRAFALGAVFAFSTSLFLALLIISSSAPQIAHILEHNKDFIQPGTFTHTILSYLTAPTPDHATHAQIWRAPLFLTLLSTFHFLEFYSTSLTNTPNATTSSFLLSTNGIAYNAAHTLSFLEISLTSLLLPAYQISVSPLILRLIGAGLVITGQIVRTTAMIQAGRSFNHTVQTTHLANHTLVTHGVYSILRHPSYFGFFWWAVGSQLLCGNVVCLLGYIIVLTRFFGRRIRSEERYLVGFFGVDYERYRGRSWVGIPGWWLV